MWDMDASFCFRVLEKLRIVEQSTAMNAGTSKCVYNNRKNNNNNNDNNNNDRNRFIWNNSHNHKTYILKLYNCKIINARSGKLLFFNIC